MFACYADYSKTQLPAVRNKNTTVLAEDLSFVDFAKERNTADAEQITRAIPAFLWTSGTTEGYRKGLDCMRGKVQGIFVKRRLNQWRLSKLS